MTKDHNQIEDFFHITSRLIIIAPLVIILLALVIKFNQNSEKKYSQTLPTPTLTLRAPNLTDLLKSNASSSAKLNLDGPFVCQVNTPTSSLSAYIKNKKIMAKFKDRGKIKNSLFVEDCLYIWQEGSYSGERICGLSKYLGIAQSLLSLNLLDFGQIVNMFNTLDSSISALPKSEIKDLMNSCQKEEVINESIFAIPKNVLFKNKR